VRRAQSVAITLHFMTGVGGRGKLGGPDQEKKTSVGLQGHAKEERERNRGKAELSARIDFHKPNRDASQREMEQG